MRTREPIQCMCDGCNKLGTGHRVSADVLTPQGPVSMGNIQPPAGWVIALVRPALATAGGNPEATMQAHDLARATGCPVQAALCEKCQRKATFGPLTPEAVPSIAADAPATDVDERAAERERERVAAEAAAEQAEREAFEAKRRAATPSEQTISDALAMPVAGSDTVGA